MNLLLLLSALLSALTGAVGGRVGGAPQAVCSRLTEEPARRTIEATAKVRPVQAQPALSTLARVVSTPLVILPAEPIFAGRRRE